MEVIYHGSGRSTVQLPAAANLASSSAAGGSSAPRTPHDDERVQGLSHLKQRLDRLQQNIRGMEVSLRPNGVWEHVSTFCRQWF